MSFLNKPTKSLSRSYSYNNLSQKYKDTELPPSSYNSNSVMYTRDWRTALRTPPTYRLGNRTFRFNYHFALLIGGAISLAVLFFYIKTKSSRSPELEWLQQYSSTYANENGGSRNGPILIYNSTYPLTPVTTHRGGSLTYRIAMIADLDTSSKQIKSDGSQFWRSYMKKGRVLYVPSKGELKITWDDGDPIAVDSSFSLKDRGMELSELVTFNGKLLTFDDRTGIVYELVNDKAIPWVILVDGDGQTEKGFKSEWATVRNQQLYVGSMGKEWTTSQGDFENENPMFVKIISPYGEVRNVNWSFYYKTLREESQQIAWPGYMIHESAAWSDVKQRWFFLPRRCSKERYNETRDEHMGCNVLISADERFTKIVTVPLESSNTTPTHGFSSFKFIPGTDDRFILAIKTEELNGKTSTYITAFGVDGKTLLAEQRIDTDLKYEGIEFI